MRLLLVIITICIAIHTSAQEVTVPILGQGRAATATWSTKPRLKRSTPIILPMKEDFSSYELHSYPSDEWWMDSMVYINNHFSLNHKNKGIATFDVLDQWGHPYYTENPNAAIYCDSLTSYYIDLSTYDEADSLYLSFDYLCGGLGFYPKPTDTLFIYFNDSISGWRQVAYILPNMDTTWKCMMVPIVGGDYFYTNFQFRIVNKGTIGISSSQWHIDNIYLNKSRHMNDTLWNDVAFNLTSTNLLNDFTAMPFNHFNTDRNGFLADSISFYNYYQSPTGVMYSSNVNWSLQHATTGSSYSTGTVPVNIAGNTMNKHSVPMVNPSSWTADGDGNLNLSMQFNINTPTFDSMKRNDSIKTIQRFQNYFAYDDGSAEQAYFLNLSPGAPGKIAMEYAMYITDTLQGIDIQFLAQSPAATYKEFYIQIYKDIEIGGSGGTLIYEQGGNYPVYSERPEAFIYYPLHTPQVLNPGIYYISIMMPASGVSDSLMIALDKNRIGGNHRYYNVLDIWESSTLEGALMVRPIVGAPISIGIQDQVPARLFTLYPNPATHYVQVYTEKDWHKYIITDIQGKQVLHGGYESSVDISSLQSGTYFFTCYVGAYWQTIPFTKL